MNNSTIFVYGSELQGDGVVSSDNMSIGLSMCVLAVLGVVLGAVNLYYIKTVNIFHNAFGWFWASRTVGEMIVEFTHATYNGPVTALQPPNIPPMMGIVPYVIFFIGVLSSCMMHMILAVNRNIAIFVPLRYGSIFSKRNSLSIVAFTWIFTIVASPLLLVLPCNLVGYSPQQLTYIFVKCHEGQERDFSYVGSTMNYLCLTTCSFTLLVDITTLFKIVYLRVFEKKHKNDLTFERTVRFFKQSAFQNVIMLSSLFIVVHQNYKNMPKDQISQLQKVLNLTEMFSLLILHIANPLALVIFNPEVRGRLFGRSTVDTDTTLSDNVTAPTKDTAQHSA
ncbi:hypothetical protein QR680_016135 [Steinernema hermaphroditum]|uniref:G-protein coupled receptors family 1 profile domain-containing protein n=1 Tax=Steinernema hermaphroditum TaxID=289476 RepID=A0AA39HA59_9BILA|nr:hypothetical protein QR680_016134 [Steinernema hermaphroditum]KAK0402082.1 hypothetical protein QR680_016135 [Steinernema hermaphroditum]